MILHVRHVKVITLKAIHLIVFQNNDFFFFVTGRTRNPILVSKGRAVIDCNILHRSSKMTVF